MNNIMNMYNYTMSIQICMCISLLIFFSLGACCHVENVERFGPKQNVTVGLNAVGFSSEKEYQEVGRSIGRDENSKIKKNEVPKEVWQMMLK